MKNILKLSVIAALALFVACGQTKKDENKKGPDSTITETQVTPNADSIVPLIDAERARIEGMLDKLERTTIETKELREQIKQKWSKIDFYTENGQIVRVKTYPYKDISTRTEEFYYQNGKLILAFIEDKGTESTGKAANRTGKTYYYSDDNFVKETNETKEPETTIRQSDSERLLQEGKEYLTLFPK